MERDDEATTRLPDSGSQADRTDRTSRIDQDVTGRYGDELPDRAFGMGGDPAGDDGFPDTVHYQPGAAASYPGYPVEPDGEDRTLLLGDDGWNGAPERPTPVRDRLLVHGVWEFLLLVLVAGLVGYCHLTEPALFGAGDWRPLLFQAALLGMTAVAVSVSLRAATPNLAVGAFAGVAGMLFAREASHGVLTAVAVAVCVTLLGGLVLGLVVGLLHVPAWAAGLVALCGGLVAMTMLGHGGAVTLPAGVPVPDPVSHASLWLAGVAGGSVLFGLLGLIGPIRRGVGAFRPVADPATRRGSGAALMAVVALTVSAGIAGGAGVLATTQTRSVAGTSSVLPDLLLALGAVLLGGVSGYGRRGGLLGTMLGVVAVTLVLRLGAYRHWPSTVTVYAVAGGAILLGLLVTRLVEWGGRRRTVTDAP